jgi:imidazoleglycerol-phosphate dehydratase
MAREAKITRTTKETDISIALNLDGTGQTSIQTGIGFFDHMLEAFGRHGLYDLDVKATGDLQVDGHHTVEDVGIVLGQAFAQAMGDKRGINRFASQAIPMDETLVLAAVDVSGRGQLHYDVDLPIEMIGSHEKYLFDTSLAKEFLIAFASNAAVTLHVKKFAGENSHHILEAAFKATGRVMSEALAINPRIADQLPTTKGAL